MDNLQHVGTPDDELISASQEHEIKYWTKKFGVSRQELLDAVNSVGSSAEAVREHLGKGSD
jgi:Protein of unknown function (DUF3606)